MKTQVIQLPEGWEIDKIEDNKIILKEPDFKLPKSWAECLVTLKNVEYIDTYSAINPSVVSNKHSCSEKYLPETYGQKFLALMQLISCRNAWWKVLKYTPDWKRWNTNKYCVVKIPSCGFNIYLYKDTVHMFAFPSREIARDFLDTFKELFDQIDDLI